MCVLFSFLFVFLLSIAIIMWFFFLVVAIPGRKKEQFRKLNFGQMIIFMKLELRIFYYVFVGESSSFTFEIFFSITQMLWDGWLSISNRSMKRNELIFVKRYTLVNDLMFYCWLFRPHCSWFEKNTTNNIVNVNTTASLYFLFTFFFCISPMQMNSNGNYLGVNFRNFTTVQITNEKKKINLIDIDITKSKETVNEMGKESNFAFKR